MADVKPKLDGTFADNPETREGKFLVVRRDGTVPQWPWFVLGARDPAAAWALWFYSWVAWFMGMSPGYCKGCNRRSWEWREYRMVHGNGDPDAGKHRVDDPATIARMREGRGA
jgi:hypothetical protein